MSPFDLTTPAEAADTAILARRSSRRAARRLVILCLAAVVGLFGIDALLFRTNLYRSWLEPDSTAGLFEFVLWREQQAQKRNGDNVVITLGDSRFAAVPMLANKLTPHSGYVFRSAGVAGSDPRFWYYMLRDLDPHADRYRAIVLGVGDYDDEDGTLEKSSDVAALHYLAGRLRLSDTLDFADSCTDPEARRQALRDGLLKGFALRQDIQAFLSHPVGRIEKVKACRLGYEEWTYGYLGEDGSMVGLRVDWAHWRAIVPHGLGEAQRAAIRNWLMRRPSPQTGELATLRRLWLGRILDRYRQSRTTVIFVRLARGPILRPTNLVRKKSAVIRGFASRPNVFLVNEHAFDALERPELFKDAVHLNREGSARFTAMLVDEVSQVLGPFGQSGKGNPVVR